MITPQQIEQISFGKQPFGGYDMEQVDEFLEPLTEDYITLYKENALLKSKMRVLVGKLEEYRKNEASMKDAIVNAQKTCDMMVKEAEIKCTQMLSEANVTAAENAKNIDSLIAEEKARLEEARKVTTGKIEVIEEQLRECLETLAQIRNSARPVTVSSLSGEDNAQTPDDSAATAVADEIVSSLEALIGFPEETAPKAEPQPAAVTANTTKFGELKFGPNYNPTQK